MEPEEPWDVWAWQLSARRDGVRLGDDRNVFRSAPWPSTEPMVPWAVYLARGRRFYTLAFDVDRGGPVGEAQVSALASLLSRAGVAFVEAVSGPSGHRHLLSTWPSGVEATHVAPLARRLRDTVAPDLDVTPLLNPATGCIRPPGALHRHGGRSAVVGPAAPALATLMKGNAFQAFEQLAWMAGVRRSPLRSGIAAKDAVAELPVLGGEPMLARSRRDLSAKMTRLLRGEASDTGTEDRSAVSAAVALAMVNAGWSFPEFRRCVLDERNRGLDHLRRTKGPAGRLVPRRDVEAAARRMWRGRVRFAASSPAVSCTPRTPALLDEVAAAAAAQPRWWGGQGGPGARVVLERMLRLARELGRTEVARSVRDLALETGLSRSAVSRVLARLQGDGWITTVAQGQGRMAACYRLQVPDAVGLSRDSKAGTGGTLAPAPQHPQSTDAGFELGVVARAHDVMTSRGLGRHAGLIAELLREAPLSMEALVARSGFDCRTVRRQLGRLAAAGLVSPGHGSDWEGHPQRLQAAATARGVAGVVRTRAEEVALERAVWAWWLADFHAERGFATRRGMRRPGRRRLNTGAPCPAQPFPRGANGRRCWSTAASWVAGGMGLMPDELANIDLTGQLGRTEPLRGPTIQRPRARRGYRRVNEPHLWPLTA